VLFALEMLLHELRESPPVLAVVLQLLKGPPLILYRFTTTQSLSYIGGLQHASAPTLDQHVVGVVRQAIVSPIHSVHIRSFFAAVDLRLAKLFSSERNCLPERVGRSFSRVPKTVVYDSRSQNPYSAKTLALLGFEDNRSGNRSLFTSCLENSFLGSPLLVELSRKLERQKERTASCCYLSS
jgi:hypothetical protein